MIQLRLCEGTTVPSALKPFKVNFEFDLNHFSFCIFKGSYDGKFQEKICRNFVNNMLDLGYGNG